MFVRYLCGVCEVFVGCFEVLSIVCEVLAKYYKVLGRGCEA